jgi:hypothetical protein
MSGTIIRRLGSSGSSTPTEVTLDMSDGAIFTAGVITIPLLNKEFDVFNLINASGALVSEIVGNSTTLKKIQRFAPQVGFSYDFDHKAVATATADQLISDAAAINTISGNDGAVIEFERVTISGARSVNRRYNAVVPV